MTFLISFLTPALVASLFTLLFNVRAEKRKDVRRAAQERLEESRALVFSAVERSAEYFSRNVDERTPEIEAKVWLMERELRFNLSSLTERTDDNIQIELKTLQRDFDLFLSELTSSNFQQKEAQPDLAQVRKIASLGADLRVSLSKMQIAETRSILEKDIFDRFLKFFEFGDHYKRRIG